MISLQTLRAADGFCHLKFYPLTLRGQRVFLWTSVYAEAKVLLSAGFRYWFDDDEIAELYRESEDFQVQTAEMELLLLCFEKPTEDNPHYSYMTTTEILTYLGIYTRHPLTSKRTG